MPQPRDSLVIVPGENSDCFTIKQSKEINEYNSNRL